MGSWRDRVLGTDPHTVGDDPDPRVSYANERTFLAWNRTALALVTAGLAISQLLPPFGFDGARRVIGIPLMVLGTVVAVLSLREWAANERAVRLHEPLPRSRLTILLALVVGAVGVVAVVVTIGWGSS
jgi:putative membrane protein